jgi:hypothetical protein
MKRFIVTGCPRSGTAYTAALFSALGLRCGHEKVYGIAQAAGQAPVDWNGADGDSSFLSVPFLPVEDAVVLHQVRHPLEFTRSIVGIAFLSEHRRGQPFPTIIEREVPEVYEPEREADRAALLWREWNLRAQAHADITYRLEDFDIPLLLRLGELLELDLSTDQAAQALDAVPRDVNRRARNETVPWRRIASVTGDLAAEYGYEAPGEDE